VTVTLPENLFGLGVGDEEPSLNPDHNPFAEDGWHLFKPGHLVGVPDDHIGTQVASADASHIKAPPIGRFATADRYLQAVPQQIVGTRR
jgi:hypothetical protein